MKAKTKKQTPGSVIPIESIENKIFIIRKQKVMLDADLAQLYQVPTKRLNEQVRRNLTRFPEDFMIRLTGEESEILRSQFATSRLIRRGRTHAVYAFTEHGVVMLSAILNSPRAVSMSIFITRAFIKMRTLIESQKELAEKVDKMEQRQKELSELLSSVYSVVKQLMNLPARSKPHIGFDQNV